MAERIDAKYLKGLRFKGSRPEDVVEEDGRKVRRYIPFERKLEPEDVLDWKDKGSEIVLVTTDGRKLTVPKEKEKNSDNGGK